MLNKHCLCCITFAALPHSVNALIKHCSIQCMPNTLPSDQHMYICSVNDSVRMHFKVHPLLYPSHLSLHIIFKAFINTFTIVIYSTLCLIRFIKATRCFEDPLKIGKTIFLVPLKKWKSTMQVKATRIG